MTALGARRRSFAAGLLVLALLAGLLLYNLVQLVRGWEELQPAGQGRQAPGFTLATLDGEQRSLSQLRGKVVLLSFWATWCLPCVKELPLLAELQQELAPRGLKILAINLEDDPAELAAFLAERQLADQLTVLQGTADVARRYGVSTLPHLVLVGADGRILEVWVGTAPEELLRKWLRGAVPPAPAEPQRERQPTQSGALQ